VHKRSLDNVLLTEIRACSDGSFICAGRLPTAHGFFNDAERSPHNDILFYTELGRQASVAVSHAFLDVSTSDVFIFEGSHAAITPAAWLPARPPSWTSVVVQVRVRDLTRRKNNAVSRLVTEHTMTIDRRAVFEGTGAFTIQPPALFQRLRRGSLAPADDAVHGSPPACVTHASCNNVVISRPSRTSPGDEFGASLMVDNAHPYFFDHPCDHVPGMLLLEGCAQLALAAFKDTHIVDTAGIAGYDASFTKFVECGIPTLLTARVDAGEHADDGVRAPVVSLRISQCGAVCGAVQMHLAVPTAR